MYGHFDVPEFVFLVCHSVAKAPFSFDGTLSVLVLVILGLIICMSDHQELLSKCVFVVAVCRMTLMSISLWQSVGSRSSWRK